MITIEPIMDFDLSEMIDIVQVSDPDWVNVGANTNHKVKLTEPDSGKVKGLIKELRKIAEVKIKPNLKRLR